MYKHFIFLALAAATGGSHAADLPPLDADVTYDSRTVTHAGVTETRQFRNLLVRRPGHVWMERVLPQRPIETAHLHPASTEAPGHKHVDFDTSSQHLTRSVNGDIRAEYVDHAQRMVVFVPPTEYSVSGFDGSWDNAAAMVAEKTVKAMPASLRKANVADAEWHEQARGGWYNRVLWSNRYKVALIIESGKIDGTVERRTVVKPKAAMADDRLPWQRLAGFTQKEYDDFMD